MSTRKEFDAYYSPQEPAQWLISHSRVRISGTIFECAAGEGAIAKPLKALGLQVWTNDIQPNFDTDYHYDNTKPKTWKNLPRFDWVISNPQFSTASDLLPLAFEHSQKGVAFFLRKSFTESCFDRQDWLKQHEDYVAQMIFCPRLSFTGDGNTDKSACDWYIWTKEKPLDGCKPTWVLKERKPKQKRAVK